MIQDFRAACRRLWRAKSFTGAAVFILTLGIAGTMVMFALIEGVLLRPLPVREQDRLIVAWKELRTSGFARYPFGNTEIESVAQSSELLENAAGVTRNGVERSVLVDNGVSSYANVALVTGGFFDVLGVRPILGRRLSRADDKEGAEHVIAISSGLWQRHYGGSPAAIGHRVVVDEQPFTIVGVMPADLDYPTGVEVWRMASSVPVTGPFGDAARSEVNLVARLRPGVTIRQAEDELVASSRRLDAQAPAGAVRGLTPVVHPFSQVVVGEIRTPMIALFCAVALVLFIATANVANLFLMRGDGRRNELAVRAALGAGPGRMVREVLAESSVVAALAGLAGSAVTWWSLQGLITLVPGGLPRVESIRVDPTVLGFAVGLVFFTALLAGLVPAVLSMRTDLLSGLRSGGHGTTASRSTRRRALVVAQVALAVTIVAGAGLLIRTVLRLQSVGLGMPAERLVLLELWLPPARYSDAQHLEQFYDRVLPQLEAIPGIAAATAVNVAPFTGQGWDLPRFTVEGQGRLDAATNPALNLESIQPNYFETLEVPVVRGRTFTPADRGGALEVAIVSEDLAARAWPGLDPLGKRLKMGDPGSRNEWYTVVGVAAPTRYRELVSPRPTLYLPAAQFQMTATMVVLRTTGSLEAIVSAARERLRSVDADVDALRVAPFTDMLAGPLARPRFNAFLLGVFAIAALLLATVGLYAVMAAYVERRNREISIRLALGATTTAVRRFVLVEGMRLGTLGAVIGLASSLGATRLVRGMLYEVGPLDPVTIAGSAALLVAASAFASYLPSRRATRFDAVATLRGE